MKTTIGFSQFINNNTPIIAQKIGDISLICASLAISIMGFQYTMVEGGFPDFTLPIFAIKIAKVCAAIGVFGKAFTKFLGVVNNSGEPVPTSEQIKITEEKKP